MSQLAIPALRHRVNDDALDVIFRTARTYNGWLDKPVSDETVLEIYDLMKWCPTSANASPARFLLLRSKAAKERLRPALAPGNVEKTMSAPITAIVAYDLRFYEKLPKLAPHNPGFRDLFANNPELAEATAKRNSTLQGAYLIIAARALDWIAARCRDLTTPRSMTSSSGRAWSAIKCAKSTCREPSNRISCATSAMATRHRFAHVLRA